jgi:hypothetical protein
LLGLRVYKPRASQEIQKAFYADVDETLHVTARTRIGLSYSRDITDSIFVPEQGTPTNMSESAGIRLEKDLGPRVYLRLYARRLESTSDGAITIDVPDKGFVTAVRKDRVFESGAELGYRFRPNFRVGVLATYNDRDSSFAYFGVHGLLLGLNAQYNPD